MGLVALALSNVATAHDVAAEIEKIRQATMRFNDVNVALAEGYILAPPGDCVDAAHEGLPAHWGAMGLHYINPCLSGCNPHPLYVGCAVIRQARVSEWKLMF